MKDIYIQIKNNLIDVEVQNKVKDYYKNKYTLEKYYEIGKLLIEAQGGEKRAKYGDGLIREYSKKLQLELDKKYNQTLLKRIRQFYLMIKKGAPMGHQLSWTHYRILLSLKNIDEITYYINKCISNNLSKRKLEELIKSKEYERLPKKEVSLQLANDTSIGDTIPNPIIIKNKLNKDVISEKLLQQLIMEDIPSFLKSLGDGFTFIDYEYPIKLGDNYNYIDILLFNYKYNCFVAIELKVTELKKEHIGQVMLYTNYIDKNLKTINQNNTIGIIISKKNNEYVIAYCTNKNISFREYKIGGNK